MIHPRKIRIHSLHQCQVEASSISFAEHRFHRSQVLGCAKITKKSRKNTKTPSGMTGFLSAVSSRGVPAPESKHPDIADIHRHGSHGLPHARPSGFLDSAFGFARNDRTIHNARLFCCLSALCASPRHFMSAIHCNKKPPSFSKDGGSICRVSLRLFGDGYTVGCGRGERLDGRTQTLVVELLGIYAL